MIEEAPGSTTFGRGRGAQPDTFDRRRLKAPTIHLHFNKLGSWPGSEAPLHLLWSYNSHQDRLIKPKLKLIAPAKLQIYEKTNNIQIYKSTNKKNKCWFVNKETAMLSCVCVYFWKENFPKVYFPKLKVYFQKVY